MARDDNHQHQASDRISAVDGRKAARPRDIPHLIKIIILILLILLFIAEWVGGEYTRTREWGIITWLILLIKLILIIGIIILIRVQRQLRCQITAPIGCATPEYDAALDKWIVKVTGTASGAVFGSYTLHVEKPAGTPFPVPVIYPGGGSSGGSPVVNGELGRLDVSHIEPAPMRVVLTVHPAGSGSTRVCTSDFDIMNRIVWVETVGATPARIVGTHPDDAGELLKLVKFAADPPLPAPPGPEASVGGGISVGGGADVSGCGQQMVEYALQYRQVPAAMPNPWQMDAPGGWSPIHSPLPYGPPGDPVHPRTFLWFFGVYENIVRHGALTRVWGIGQFLMSLFPTPTYAARPYTAGQGWNTTALNGRYTVRLVVKTQPVIGPPSPTPAELYDSATVWIDNRTIEGFISHLGIEGGGSLGVCEELSLSQFVGPGPVKINATINGRAWDPIITDDYPGTLVPNDNFDFYSLTLQKNGGGAVPILPSSGTRVPAVLQEAPLAAPPADIGVLHLWDIVAALDAGPPQPGPAPYPKIYRGDRCAYIIHLHVQDRTSVGDGATVHWIPFDFPFCIENDISPDNVPFPVPGS